MKKLESSLINMVLVATLGCLIAAGILGSVYNVTKAPIEQAKLLKQQNALKAVLPEGAIIDSEPVTLADHQVYKAYDSNKQLVGIAVETSSDNGYAGTLKVMVGFDQDGQLINYSILESAETPGLGARAEQWFRTNHNKQSVLGLNPGKANFTPTKDGGDVDAITAATITSRAFLGSIRSAYQSYEALSGKDGATEAHTGATPPCDKASEAGDGSKETTAKKTGCGGCDHSGFKGKCSGNVVIPQSAQNSNPQTEKQ